MVLNSPKNNITLRHDWINNFPVNLFMAQMELIGKFYNTFSNIETSDLISVYRNNNLFKGIHHDSDEEQLPENDTFLRISSII